MSNIAEVFRQKADALLAQYSDIAHTWLGPDKQDRITLKIPKTSESGFDVLIDCFPYALYPTPDWFNHAYDGSGVPAANEEMAGALIEHLQSLLSGATLHVRYAGETPVSWSLTSTVESGTSTSKGRRIFFNYFAPRSERTFRNAHIAPAA